MEIKSHLLSFGDVRPLKKVAWISNTKVVFNGVHDGRPGLYLWSVGASEVDELANVAPDFCVDQEGALYARSQPRSELTKISFDHDGAIKNAETLPLSGFNFSWCQRLPRPAAEHLRSHALVPLYYTDYLLDLGPAIDNQGTVSVLDQQGNTKGSLPEDIDSRLSLSIVPSAYAQATVISENDSVPAVRDKWLYQGYAGLWSVKPDLAVSITKVPTGLWTKGKGATQFFLTNCGSLVVSRGFERDGTPGTAGLYHLSQSAPERQLATGLVEAAVSPNGGKVAFILQQSFAVPVQRKLLVEPICKDGAK